jgi:hypothetical protein
VTAHLALVIAVTAAGVLLPKVGPALLTPARSEGSWAAVLRVLPAATVGALAAVTALGPHAGGRFRPEVAIAAAAAAAGTLAVRRFRRAAGPKA